MAPAWEHIPAGVVYVGSARAARHRDMPPDPTDHRQRLPAPRRPVLRCVAARRPKMRHVRRYFVMSGAMPGHGRRRCRSRRSRPYVGGSSCMLLLPGPRRAQRGGALLGLEHQLCREEAVLLGHGGLGCRAAGAGRTAAASRRTRCGACRGDRPGTGDWRRADRRCRCSCAPRCTPSVPRMTSRPSPQLARPSGVYQSQRTYPLTSVPSAVLPRTTRSSKSSKAGYCG